ncbi:MAG: ABC transporter ATP-binding protein [Myxococcales bacterium]|nr:ABC transporter ATP-binding protein [Myxococcales bacterium]
MVVRGLGKDYGARTAVAALDLEVPSGSIFGLLGPNGAGKTTTISMIAGVVTPDRGTAMVAGHRVGAKGDAAKRALGLCPQELALYEDLTALQNLTFFARLYGLHGRALADALAWALDVAGLAERAREPVRTFSGGMKRRLNLAAAILHKPTLVILDEPTVGVDPQSRRHVFDAIRALRDDGMTVLYTSHYLEEVAELCDQVAIMDHGEIVAQGTLAELVARHGGVPPLELELAGDPAAVLAARALAARHGPLTGAGAVLRLPRPPALAPLFADLETAGATVVRVTAQATSLETVFLTLTGHSLRDE